MTYSSSVLQHIPGPADLVGVIGRVTRRDLAHVKQAALLFDHVAIAEIVVSDLSGGGLNDGPLIENNFREVFTLLPQIDDGICVRAPLYRPLGSDAVARYLASEIGAHYGCAAVALLPPTHSSVGEGQLAATLKATLVSLPLPDVDTPWSAIWDWRSDNEARRMYSRLRSYINGLSRTGFSQRELVDDIAAQLADYETYMSLHHRKMSRGRVEIVVTAIAELLEGIATFRWSEAVKRLFALQRNEMVLLEAELTAPGREVAYISETARRFGMTTAFRSA